MVIYLDRIVVKVKDIFSPDDEIAIIRVGDRYIIEKISPEKVLNRISEKFRNLSDEEKVKIALEAKKWSRK